MPTLSTWGGRKQFQYAGSVQTGTSIIYGQNRRIRVQAGTYVALRIRFRNQVVRVGTSRNAPPAGSLGAWLKTYVTAVAIASYVAPILVNEGYAQKVGRYDIHIVG